MELSRNPEVKENPKLIQAMKEGKAPLEYLISSVNAGEARVLKGGADDYGIRNWLVDKVRATTYIGAMRRHLDDWSDGLNADKKSGEHPLQHVRACCGIIIDAAKHDTLIDDRMTQEYLLGPAKKPQPVEPLITVTFSWVSVAADHVKTGRTKTFGPFTTKDAAVEFVRQTRGQIDGIITFNTLLPIDKPEIQNDRDRNQKTDSSRGELSRSAHDIALTIGGDADASARANIREALRRAEGGSGAGSGKD